MRHARGTVDDSSRKPAVMGMTAAEWPRYVEKGITDAPTVFR